MTTPPKPNVPERYVKALDSADPLHVLRKTPKRLRKLLKGAKPKELSWKADPATWSVHEVIGHLADNEFVFGSRVRFIAAEDRPLLPAYDEKRFLANLGIDRSSLEDLFDVWVAARAANVHLLDRLPENAWSRIGVHSERGELSLMQIVVGGAGHDRVHEEQIERTIARARAARRDAKEREREAAKAAKSAKAAKKRSDSPVKSKKDGHSGKSEAKKDSKPKDAAKLAKANASG
ncbi:MAG: DinB family protein [Planctomycetota bacterium]|nr:DinB family protein [Planctomycetota bacterium]